MTDPKKQSTEYHLHRLINYLHHYSEICKSISSYFRTQVEDKYGLVDFYEWCSHDLNVSADKVNSYIQKIGGSTKFEEVEAPPKREYGTPIQSLEFCHKEDARLNDLITELYNFAESNNDENLKSFVHKELIVPFKAWNKNFENSLPRLRSSTQEQFGDAFNNTFQMMKKYRSDLSV